MYIVVAPYFFICLFNNPIIMSSWQHLGTDGADQHGKNDIWEVTPSPPQNFQTAQINFILEWFGVQKVGVSLVCFGQSSERSLSNIFFFCAWEYAEDKLLTDMVKWFPRMWRILTQPALALPIPIFIDKIFNTRGNVVLLAVQLFLIFTQKC